MRNKTVNFHKQIVKGHTKQDLQIKLDNRLINGWEIGSETKYIDGKYQVLMTRDFSKQAAVN